MDNLNPRFQVLRQMSENKVDEGPLSNDTDIEGKLCQKRLYLAQEKVLPVESLFILFRFYVK